MLHLIETFESRNLLSASPAVISQDLAALTASRTQLAADVKTAGTNLSADAKAIKASLGAAQPTKPEKQELGVVLKEQKTQASTYKREATALLKGGTKAGKSLLSLLKKLNAQPTNTTLQPKVTAALAKLQGIFSTQAVTGIESDLNTLIAGAQNDLNTLATDVPSATASISALQSHLSAEQTTLATDLTSIQSGISTLAGDLA